MTTHTQQGLSRKPGLLWRTQQGSCWGKMALQAAETAAETCFLLTQIQPEPPVLIALEPSLLESLWSSRSRMLPMSGFWNNPRHRLRASCLIILSIILGAEPWLCYLVAASFYLLSSWPRPILWTSVLMSLPVALTPVPLGAHLSLSLWGQPAATSASPALSSLIQFPPLARGDV